MSSVFISDNEAQPASVGLFLTDSKKKIQGRWNTLVDYQDQSILKTSITAEVTDDYSLKNHARLSLQLDL